MMLLKSVYYNPVLLLQYWCCLFLLRTILVQALISDFFVRNLEYSRFSSTFRPKEGDSIGNQCPPPVCSLNAISPPYHPLPGYRESDTAFVRKKKAKNYLWSGTLKMFIRGDCCCTALLGISAARMSIGKEQTIYNTASCDTTAASEVCKMSEGNGKPKRKLRHVRKYLAKDFSGSKWTIAIMWEGKAKPWVTKMYMREDGQLIWLNKAPGSWRVNTRARTLNFHRNFFVNWGGSRCFLASLERPYNEYYLEGYVNGWGPWFALKTMGYFQAVRENVDLNKYGVPPWYQIVPLDGIEVVSTTVRITAKAPLGSRPPPSESEEI